MACHAFFNHALANYFLDFGRRDNLKFLTRATNEEGYVGDLVVFSPFKQQSRFDIRLGGDRYQIVHMKGKIHDHALTVSGIGKAREEWCRNQSNRIPKANLNLFEDGSCFQDDGRATRIILATEVLAGMFRLGICLNDGEHHKKDGLIVLSSREILVKDTVANLANQSPRAQDWEISEKDNQGIDFEISDKSA